MEDRGMWRVRPEEYNNTVFKVPKDPSLLEEALGRDSFEERRPEGTERLPALHVEQEFMSWVKNNGLRDNLFSYDVWVEYREEEPIRSAARTVSAVWGLPENGSNKEELDKCIRRRELPDKIKSPAKGKCLPLMDTLERLDDHTLQIDYVYLPDLPDDERSELTAGLA